MRLYRALTRMLLPLALARLAIKSLRDPGYREHWRERLGYAGCGSADVWLHAVSVGEVRSAAPLIKALRECRPDLRLLMTASTPTGYRQIAAVTDPGVLRAYLPYDTPSAVERFLTRVRPQAALIMETEIWPNLFQAIGTRGIPLFLVNGRLSERSFHRYRRVRPLTRVALQAVHTAWVQTVVDQQRFEALGLATGRAIVAGNLKFDMPLPDGQEGAHERRLLGLRRVLLAASTHEGEEEAVLAAYEALRAEFPEILLVLAPRHPDRAPAVGRLLARHRLSWEARSQGAPCDPQIDVLLVDTLGELHHFFALAECAFVGGSLVARGGHNILEACAHGVPVVFGPHMDNFLEIAQLVLQAGAGTQIPEPASLTGAWRHYLADTQLRTETGRHGRLLLEANRGALQQTVDGILKSVGGAR